MKLDWQSLKKYPIPRWKMNKYVTRIALKKRKYSLILSFLSFISLFYFERLYNSNLSDINYSFYLYFLINWIIILF